MRSRSADTREVMFIVEYQDGRLQYVTASNRDLRNGDRAALAIASMKQQDGEIPEGAIISVKRVH
jgi:hypothetical protein